MRFSAGLNVISGETGAGKSLVAGAIGLALGARASNDLIRTGSEQASVSAVFSPARESVWELLEAELGLATGNSEGLIFERRLSRKKSSRMLVAGKPVTAVTAQTLADALLDIAAQNEHTQLADPGYQRRLLDRYGAVKTTAYTEVYTKAAQILKRIDNGNADLQKHQRERERIEHKLKKIADFAPDPELDQGIEERIEAVSEAENITELAEEAVDYLYEGEGAVLGRLATLLRTSVRYAELSPRLAAAAATLEEAVALLDDAARAYREVAEEQEYSAADLDNLIERAEGLKALGRVLEVDTADNLYANVIQRRAELIAQRDELALWQISTEELEQELNILLPELISEGEKLSAAREQAGKKLSKVISRELKELGMENADFDVVLRRNYKPGAEPREILARVGVEGFDEVGFMITPNPGEAASSIAETASGGEASRAMLAIKSALATVYAPETLLFDEIDTGVGGRLGDVLGRKLYELSRQRQVIVITHLPQIAAYADTHLQVTKVSKNKRTLAQVQELGTEERVEEIAQMINGKAATETTRTQAREMLAKRK